MTPLDGRDQQILHRLAQGGWISGASLAAELQISRAALSKRMERLRCGPWGLAITSRHGAGYALEGGLDLLTAAPELAQPELRDIPKLRIVSSCSSTNAVLAQDSHTQTLCTEFQEQGRGRLGRTWVAPYASSLLLSHRHRYSQWPDNLAALSLVLGLALCRWLNHNNIPVRLKWPNDLWLNDKKLAGMLIESRGEALSGCELIVGLGLNVHTRVLADVEQPWTSLAQAGFQAKRADLLRDALACLTQALQAFVTRPLSAQLDDYDQWDALHGRQVQLRDGDTVHKGRNLGITAQGALRLADADGVQRHFAVGDLSLRPQGAA